MGIRIIPIQSLLLRSERVLCSPNLAQLQNPSALAFTPDELRDAMLETIATLNMLAEEAGITEPSLMNFCITDGESVVASRYISSRKDEAASLVRLWSCAVFFFTAEQI